MDQVQCHSASPVILSIVCMYLYRPTAQGPSPTHLSSADSVVQDLLVCSDTLFSASGNIINVWDLRQSVEIATCIILCSIIIIIIMLARMNTIGRLVGHTGTIGTMTDIPGGYIATGSRDRLIKV